jgi:hypothetical protein
MEKIRNEALLSLAIVAELVFGFLTGLLILGLVPADGVDFNVVGSLVLMVPCAVVYHLAGKYVTARVPGRR